MNPGFPVLPVHRSPLPVVDARPQAGFIGDAGHENVARQGIHLGDLAVDQDQPVIRVEIDQPFGNAFDRRRQDIIRLPLIVPAVGNDPQQADRQQNHAAQEPDDVLRDRINPGPGRAVGRRRAVQMAPKIYRGGKQQNAKPGQNPCPARTFVQRFCPSDMENVENQKNEAGDKYAFGKNIGHLRVDLTFRQEPGAARERAALLSLYSD